MTRYIPIIALLLMLGISPYAQANHPPSCYSPQIAIENVANANEGATVRDTYRGTQLQGLFDRMDAAPNFSTDREEGLIMVFEAPGSNVFLVLGFMDDCMTSRFSVPSDVWNKLVGEQNA